MPLSRETICRSAAEQLRAGAERLAARHATIGFDGFVDEILAVVEKRLGPDSFEPVGTLAQLGAKIAAAAGQSSNLELVVRRVKLGGNGPIMANALASLGVQVNYIGSLGFPHLDPVFAPLAARTTAISIGNPGHTDALEFADGKLMLGKHAPLAEITWPRLLERVGREPLDAMIAASDLVGLLNWTMLPAMSDIWRELIAADVFAQPRPGRRLFIDLCDPDKRTAASILEALDLLRQFQRRVDVALGLNLREAQALAAVLGLAINVEPELAPNAKLASVADLARRLRERAGVAMVIVHPREGAAVATADASAWFAGPFVAAPKISTGGGDHFNAGFAAALMLDMPLAECLCVGVATSGLYVRSAESPGLTHLVDFIATLPPPSPTAAGA